MSRNDLKFDYIIMIVRGKEVSRILDTNPLYEDQNFIFWPNQTQRKRERSVGLHLLTLLVSYTELSATLWLALILNLF